MITYKHILCPLDFGDLTNDSLFTANDLAQHYGAVLHLVHVIPPLMIAPASVGVLAPPLDPTPVGAMAFNSTAYLRQLETEAHKRMQELVELHVSPEVTLKTTIVHGVVSTQIVEIAEAEGADLIVIATHGRSRLRHLLFTSTYDLVIRRTKVPVLTVKPHRVAA